MTYKGVTVGCEPKTAIYHSTCKTCMMINTKHAVPFKDSDERRDFEAISFQRRQSYQSTAKTDRDLESVQKATEASLAHEIKKLQVTQSKLTNRIQDLKSTSEKPIRWSSLPKISESADTDAASPVDPYPVTFVSLSSIKMPGGGKFFPRLQRRKSKEFEDLPRLSYEQFSPIVHSSPDRLSLQTGGQSPRGSNYSSISRRAEQKENRRKISPIRSQSETQKNSEQVECRAAEK